MRFEWEALLRAGIAMGLRPEAFWRLTPAEFRLYLGDGAAPMGRQRLEALMAAFPDKMTGGEDGSG